MEDEQEWVKGEMNVTDEDVEFEASFFLSTDGKMTVSAKATTRKGRKAAAEYAVRAYERLVQRFGTKQAQAVKEYSKSAEEHSLGNCRDCGAPNAKSLKGKVYCSAKCWLKKQAYS